MHPLHKFIEKFARISDEDWSRVEPCLRFRPMLKNEILRVEEPGGFLYFMESGLLRFYSEKEGKEITQRFMTAPNVFMLFSVDSSRDFPMENIQAMDRCCLWQMSHADAEDLNAIPSWKKFVGFMNHQNVPQRRGSYTELHQLTARFAI